MAASGLPVWTPLPNPLPQGERERTADAALKSYFPFPARLSRNTPCSPNMFQNHQGMLTRSGRP